MSTPEHIARPNGADMSSLDALSTEDFLHIVGQRVRKQRSHKSMSRKRLAEVSGVSERYLAQLESGQGNMSIALLRKVTTAIGMSLGELMSAEVPENKPELLVPDL
ncbi:MAG: helix-turn-helix domain-containing protein [Granulosicoccus sp.]